jgi:hypothetical protein
MRGALGGGETTMTLVSANRMERRDAPALLLVCTERYRMVPAGQRAPVRPAEGR